MLNPFTTEFLRTLPTLDLDMSINTNRGSVKKKNSTANSVDPDKTVLSGSTLFALVFVRVYMVERVMPVPG